MKQKTCRKNLGLLVQSRPSTLKFEAAVSSEIVLYLYETTQTYSSLQLVVSNPFSILYEDLTAFLLISLKLQQEYLKKIHLVFF
jgi:flagellar assembly factor FliW